MMEIANSFLKCTSGEWYQKTIGFIIRPYDHTIDSEGVLSCAHKSWEIAYPDIPVSTRNSYVNQAYKGPYKGIFLVAVKDFEVIGFIHLNYVDMAKDTHEISIDLFRLYVSPLYIHQGIGTSLLSHACTQVIQEMDSNIGIVHISLHVHGLNTSAKDFYKKRGFCFVKKVEPLMILDGHSMFDEFWSTSWNIKDAR